MATFSTTAAGKKVIALRKRIKIELKSLLIDFKEFEKEMNTADLEDFHEAIIDTRECISNIISDLMGGPDYGPDE